MFKLTKFQIKQFKREKCNQTEKLRMKPNKKLTNETYWTLQHMDPTKRGGGKQDIKKANQVRGGAETRHLVTPQTNPLNQTEGQKVKLNRLYLCDAPLLFNYDHLLTLKLCFPKTHPWKHLDLKGVKGSDDLYFHMKNPSSVTVDMRKTTTPS